MGSDNTRNAALAGIFAILCLLLVFFSWIGSSIHDDLDRSNKIECIKLRESADSLGPIDREACPWEMSG